MSLMRKIFSILAICALLDYAAPASAQMAGHGGDDHYGSPHEMPTPDAGSINVGPDPEGNAENLRLQGKCDKAVGTLRRFARRGAGYEVAQYNLGLCLYDLSAIDKPNAVALRSEGAGWIIQAANGGSAMAQAEAVRILLAGDGVAADPVEADKWAVLYRRNPSRTTFGLRDLPAETMAKLDALTDAQQTEAEHRAHAWVQTPRQSE